MKKIDRPGKLDLKKVSIRILTPRDLERVPGGKDPIPTSEINSATCQLA